MNKPDKVIPDIFWLTRSQSEKNFILSFGDLLDSYGYFISSVPRGTVEERLFLGMIYLNREGYKVDKITLKLDYYRDLVVSLGSKIVYSTKSIYPSGEKSIIIKGPNNYVEIKCGKRWCKETDGRNNR